MNGLNGGMDENQRTKSFGQLYEQIWSNNNNNVNSINSNQQQRSNNLNNNPAPHQTIHQHQYQAQSQNHNHNHQHIHFAASVDDLNLKNLEINNRHFANNNNLHTNGSISTHVLNENSNKVTNQQNMRKLDFIDTSSTPSLTTQTNYTNKVSRSNMQPTTTIMGTHNGLSNMNRGLPINNRQLVSNDLISNENQFDLNGKF